MTLHTLTQFLGWVTLINIGLLSFTTVALLFMRGFAVKVHARMFAIEERDLNRAYFQYMAQFKMLVIVFNLTPYLALRIMG
jgi:Family of unknown function (DUF6868)